MSRSVRAPLAGLAVAVVFALPLLPEIFGSRLLVFRDAQITHWPWRREAASALASGHVPFVNASASGGEPLLANPNAVLLYPTFLFERVFPPEAAFNLHYLVHVLWAYLGARLLARRLGLSPGAALFSGVAYGFSGMMLSYGSAFMNSSAAAAWLPWCGAAFVDLGSAADARSRLRAAAAAGLALGLQLLAGEPAITLVTLALGACLLAAGARRAGVPFAGRLARGLAASLLSGTLAIALAAPLLLPLRAVFGLTYRGQHLYSERASGAAAFSAGRAVEWLLPRFGGSPELLGGGANWLRSIAREDFVYIWCVTFGVVPLAVVLLAALRRDFWDRRAALLAAGGVGALLFSFGFTLPFYRLVFAIAPLRKLRYPIKFYLLTSVAAALLAGLAADSLGRRRWGRRESALAAVFLVLFAAAFFAAAPGGALDRWAGARAERIADDPAAFLAVFRGLVRGDALIGAACVLVVALVVRPAAGGRTAASLLALLALVSALPWGLPLFVSAPSADLLRPPALAHRLQGPGRLYVSPRLPLFDASALKRNPSDELPRSSRVARILVEQLVPATGSPFGARYLFENDPDGSYGFFNRVASEAAEASTPSERDRLLRLYGGRWVLAPEGEEHPLFRPVTGLEVAGRRLVLSESADAMPELRWAGRVWRRPALSATLELVRSEAFEPRGDVVLPGRAAEDPAGPGSTAALSAVTVAADGADVLVDAAAPGHLVFSRTFFPAWLARVDGQAAPAVVANARELAVAVPAGRHRVAFSWDAGPFRRGVALQALAVFAAALAALGSRQKPQLVQKPQVDVRAAAV
ncbi:MAG TPA: hypothetical protein VMN82_16280 [Thermoanaerobaculia bacterium]|nr:hypothetical protein [Thermoanaerobaculia bacterium]